MRAVDLIRGILDLIDRDTPKVSVTTITSEPKGSEEDRRMNQISDLVTDPFTAPELANAPDEKIADIDAVTIDAGGGMSGPKEPEDIRGEHGSLFRDYLARAQRNNLDQ